MNVINTLARVKTWLFASAVLLYEVAAQAGRSLNSKVSASVDEAFPRNNARSLRAGTLED